MEQNATEVRKMTEDEKDQWYENKLIEKEKKIDDLNRALGIAAGEKCDLKTNLRREQIHNDTLREAISTISELASVVEKLS